MLCSSNLINTKALDYFLALKRIRDYFETNYADPISLKKAAAIAGLEPKYFSRMFRAHVGIGFKEWTDLMRVQKAMDAMQKEDQPVITVGYAVGFQSPATFQRLFKKYAGMKPSDFKKAVVKEISRAEDTPVM